MAKNNHLEIYRNSDGTYSVALLFRPAGEEMYDTATHCVHFQDRADAEHLRQRIAETLRAASFRDLLNGPFHSVLDKKCWHSPTSMACGYRWNEEIHPYCVPSQKRVA